MQGMVKFIEEYERLKTLYPELYVSICEMGIRNYWRISVFGKDMGIIGDAEFMTVEAESKEKAFEMAIKKIVFIPTQISEAISIKTSGRVIGKSSR